MKRDAYDVVTKMRARCHNSDTDVRPTANVKFDPILSTANLYSVLPRATTTPKASTEQAADKIRNRETTFPVQIISEVTQNYVDSICLAQGTGVKQQTHLTA